MKFAEGDPNVNFWFDLPPSVIGHDTLKVACSMQSLAVINRKVSHCCVVVLKTELRLIGLNKTNRDRSREVYVHIVWTIMLSTMSLIQHYVQCLCVFNQVQLMLFGVAISATVDACQQLLGNLVLSTCQLLPTNLGLSSKNVVIAVLVVRPDISRAATEDLKLKK